MTVGAVPLPDSQAGPSRRAVVIGAIAAGVGLSACGGGDDSADNSGGGPTTPAAAGVSAQKAEIPVGGGTVFGDQRVVVTQPTQGQFKAFTAVCTHQGCTLAKVEEGTINCPCHGSKFNIADGSVKAGPAPRPLAAKTVTVNGETITVG